MKGQLAVALILFGCGLFGLAGVDGRTAKELLVTLPNGSKLAGRGLQSHDGRPIKAFMGIPFAQPPIGNLRFKNPLPANPWVDVLDATKSPSICIQTDPSRRDSEIEGSEDCLYLNVYVPHSEDVPQKDLPVMVMFHGGGFVSGSGIESFYGPDHLLDHDIVYVSGNYRLGPLGFLSTGQEDCPGNFGLKDQVLVLEWVKENIATFGGDPNGVTIFGHSAGGASVTFLMMSPLTNGLFTKAIAQSGTNHGSWACAYDGIAEKRAAQLTGMVGCGKLKSWKQKIECLRGVPAKDITATFYKFFEWDTDPAIPFPPVVEPDLPGAFITVHPRDDNVSHGHSVSFLTGITSGDGAIKSAPILLLPDLMKDLSENYYRALPIIFNYDHHPPAVRSEITNRIIQYYFSGEAPSVAKGENLTNLFTDGFFLRASDFHMRQRLANPNAGPTYVYLFSHKGSASYSEITGGGRENYYGTSHADELIYLFPLRKSLFYTSLPSKRDEQIRKSIIELWVNFARSGNPTPSTSDLPKWQPTSTFPLNYYRIGNQDDDTPVIEMEMGLYDDRARFWRELGAHLPANRQPIQPLWNHLLSPNGTQSAI